MDFIARLDRRPPPSAHRMCTLQHCSDDACAPADSLLVLKLVERAVANWVNAQAFPDSAKTPPPFIKPAPPPLTLTLNLLEAIVVVLAKGSGKGFFFNPSVPTLA